MVGGLLLLANCGDDGSGGEGAAGGGVASAGNGSAQTGSGGPTGAGSGGFCDEALGPDDVVFLDAAEVVHEGDYLDLSEFVNPAVPKNWESPVDYANGEVTVCIELLEIGDPSAVPIYYLVGWGDGADGYIRGGAMFEEPAGQVKERVPVKDFQRVVNGVDAGSVGDDWDWSNAFDTVNGDAWGSSPPYPLRARVKLTLHPN